jgi:hypothetical protein
MNTVRNWMDAPAIAANDDYGYRAEDAVRLAGDAFDDNSDDLFDMEEPDFSDLDI